VILYSDAEDAYWDKNFTAYRIENMKVDHNTEPTMKLAAGGDAAISFMLVEYLQVILIPVFARLLLIFIFLRTSHPTLL